MNTNPSREQQIAALNDNFRSLVLHPLLHLSNRIVVTSGVFDLIGTGADKTKAKALLVAVRDFDDFGNANDPFGEHDFGAFDFDGERVFWKIDYYSPDSNRERGSEDPADPTKTVRVMTVMLASEY